MSALEGVVVVDLTHAVAGPFCTLQLLRLGAEVVKVERPAGGDDFRARLGPGGRPVTFDALNARKRSVALDLRSEGGRNRLLGLVAGADVLVENFRPGVMDELGLGWERLREVNRRLIACSISGFGQSGPMAGIPAIEWSVQAALGLTDAYVDPDADPLRLGLSVLDPFTGFTAFAQILAALRDRDRTGSGCWLDIAMVDAAVTLMWPQVAETLASGSSTQRLGRRGTMARFRTADCSLFVAALHQRWFEGLCEEIAADDLARDARFASPAARAERPDEVHRALSGRLASVSGRALEPRLHARGIPAAVVRTLEEALRLPAIAERHLLDGATEHGPDLGADTAAVLEDTGEEEP
ncbi:MAG: CoA transferase [Candidatus Dormibacteraeota bacterium]|nr:CoA transferase [Candidatus Dormibacteraeota bacterium]